MEIANVAALISARVTASTFTLITLETRGSAPVRPAVASRTGADRGQPGFAQAVGMSAPPSCEIRAPNLTKPAWLKNFPATNVSPMRKVVARSISPGGTKEKTSPRYPRSASEFIRIRSRLSHWDSTSSLTFWGRWVEVSR